METVDLSGAEEQIIKIIRSLKPFQRIEIMADGQGRPDVYIVLEASKRMVFPNKTIFMQTESKVRLDI